MTRVEKSERRSHRPGPATRRGSRPLGRTLPLLASLAAAAAVAPASSASDSNGYLSLRGMGGVGISYTDEGFDQFWVGETRVSNPGVGALDRKSLSLWLGYGVTDDFTVTLNLPYIRTRADGSGGFAERSLQDLAVVGSYRLLSTGRASRSTLVGSVGVRAPAADYRTDNPGDVGDGTTDFLARVVYRINYRRVYLSQQVGYDLRGGEAPDSFPFYTEAGMGYGRFTVSAFFSKYVTLEGTDIGPGVSFPSNREEWDRIGAKVYMQAFDRLGVSLLAFHVLDGRNTGRSAGVGFGVFIPF